MKSLLKFSLIVLMLVILTAAVASYFFYTVNNGEEGKEKELIVATDTAFRPFEFKEGNKYVGFDIDLWDAIAKELKLSYILKPMDFSGIIPALQSRNIDLAIAGITITDSRKKAVDFTDGYYTSGLLLMVRKDDKRIQSVNDLADKIIAVKSGTGSVEYAQNNIKSKELRQFPNIDNAWLELASKRADAVLHDAPNILAFIKISGNTQFKTVGNLIEAQQYGIALPQGSDELREKINTVLQALRDNGTYAQIYNKWFSAEPN